MSKSLVLKVVSSEMKSYGGFQWPDVGGTVFAKRWSAAGSCGKGLHGWLNGVGETIFQKWSEDKAAKWLVLSVDTDRIVHFEGKVKFPSAEVVYVGGMADAAQFILDSGFSGPVIGTARVGGARCVLTGGDYSNLTGGDFSILTGGRESVIVGGVFSKIIGGDKSILTGGRCSIVVGGSRSTLTGGKYSRLSGGIGSTLIGGDESILQIIYYQARMRIATAYVGEGGILPKTPYKLDSNNDFVEVKDA